ncbi:DUF2599 domain-containing protein [Pseudomonas xanthosomatis]|uniref:DUF2599 domain-containing protein n=1 Tax=Pseudomonas xanthosomatis TaxID=2842356 RepID=UPI001C3E0128|nr:DUF2599 domain-containing protein [Pseudomonas xanthosomatis]QXH44440.1 DUF2599 domain-containing protein [Pseudomonas xanthosomatis]
MNAFTGKLLPAIIVPLIIFSNSAISADSCESVVQDLTKWYNSTPSDCGLDPAADCSGIMMRATQRAPNGEWDVWNPSPKSEASGGVSVSWMRSDRIGYEDPGMNSSNGIIFTPRQFVKEPQKKLDIFCAFPIDAWTDDRANRGCGDNSATAATEKSCQALGIKDLAAWQKQYAALAGSADRNVRHRLQCGFDMGGDLSRTERRDAFKQFIAARQAIANTQEGRQVQTELRMVAWKKGEDVPVAAFFYSNPQGLSDARKNQFDYYQRTGRWVPVVKMDFPADSSKKTAFSCEANAQHRDLPRPYTAPRTACKQYIDKAEWVRRDDPFLGKGTWTLAVTPTECGRKIKADETEAMYAELVRKYADDPRWSGAGYGAGMRRQLVCHLAYVDPKEGPVRNKPSYNLEPARPDVSDEVSKQNGCNPY